MTITDIRKTMTAMLLRADPTCKVIHGDVSEPVTRGAYKIDVLPADVSVSCAGTRERQADIDIWYYPMDKTRPRDACERAVELLIDTFAEGFSAGSTWIYPDENISLDVSQGVLIAQFGISWSESIHDSGETMETLTYNREELTD